MTRRRTVSVIVDGCGLVVLLSALGAAWLAERSGGTAGPIAALLLGVAGAVVLGRLLGLVHRGIVPAAIVLMATAPWFASPDVLGGGPLGGPFGYRNATGAFYAQAAIAGLLLAATVRWLPVRLVAFLAAGGFALVAVIGSSAAAASLAVVPIALLALGGRVWARVSVAVAGVLVLLVLAGTVVLGATYRPGSDGEVVRALSERRLVLWHESLRLIADHPGGVGPGRFRDVDPTARRDADARWAHNEFLQQGVELGWAGLVLTVLLFAWGFARLLVRPDPDVAVGLGAAALAALGIHASVDYVLHFAAVPLTAAALVGTAQAAPIRRFRRGRHEPGQEDLEGGADAVRVAGTTTSR